MTSKGRATVECPKCQSDCIFKNAETLDVRPFLLTVSFSWVKKKSRRFPKEQTFHHNVYVILLSDSVAKHPSILRLNPKRDP